MITVSQIILGFIVSTEIVFGNFGNGLIVLVNCAGWVKKRKISSADKILTALAISRIFHLWVMLTYLYISIFDVDLFLDKTCLIISCNAWTVSNHFSLWFATNLSIFYFLKIATFSNPIFLYLKWRVKKTISFLFLMVLLFWCFNTALINIQLNIWINEHEKNMTYSLMGSDFAQFASLTVWIIAIFTSIPFTVSLITFLLLIFSLWKHHKKMTLNGKGHRDVSSKAHIKAMQTVISFLLLYAVFFLSYFIPVWRFHSQKRIILSILSQVLALFYPSGHSILLILGNKKLKQTFLSVVWELRYWLKGRKVSFHR
ncbi:PREDICTED: taste receptor type 2 member 14-like [Elephantulus edwardii]|uniref:taste receptor type 2 member 14-like n=1 Tax=Elephantulus edwardii TaxID=28737 RepID=UPI0003F06EE8|nr:PREDICTED: taste receptor type 2 member 14-like [Elephantulus edwardii]